MSLRNRLLAGTATILAASTFVQAQEVKISGLAQVWYTQMLSENLRQNSNSIAPNKYYNLRSEYQENTFSIRRTEIKLSGKIMDGVEFETMIDPSINTSSTNPSILQDAAIKINLAEGFDMKLGQFKNLQTLEGNTSSSELVFAERSQLGRVFGDKRDRGVVFSYAFGDPKEFGAKISIGAFNGMCDAVSGKGSDLNAQKDYAARLDMNVGKEHKFVFYTLQGVTDVKDVNIDIAAKPAAGWPSQLEVFENKDKFNNIGAFYAFQNESWLLSAEVITGVLGRRTPTLAASSPAIKREHLDQKFMGFYATLGYTFGNHGLAVRYDEMNYNSGNDWYGATSPYVLAEPKYKEATLGYTFAFKPGKVKAANFKLNYIHRSSNFLKPRADQNGAQGGNTLMAAFQVAF